MNGQRFSTLQIPTTLPTADELLGRDGLTPEHCRTTIYSNSSQG